MAGLKSKCGIINYIVDWACVIIIMVRTYLLYLSNNKEKKNHSKLTHIFTLCPSMALCEMCYIYNKTDYYYFVQS
jgi:hypothetical protein